MNEFGNKVRELRRQHDLTQEELARRVGCAAITIRKIEASDLRPSKQIAELLAKALAIPLEERADFVRQARSVKPGGAEPSPTPAPQVKREEIGGEDLSGRAIRGYTLGERIGEGGFGVVYRGVQPLVDREVAIKIILPEFADHPEFIRRFEAEAQVVARLEHPHIVPLYDYWREPSVAYLVMRLLRGGSVQERLQNGPLPLESASVVFDQVSDALHAAHRLGVVHRDLKPANVLLDEDDNAYLADFGIAKTFSNWDIQTQAGAFIGSPAYSSPEQIRAEPILPQTDIYALGVLLFELLTGERPFTSPTPVELVQQHLSDPMPPLASRQSGLPAELDSIIARATAKDPLQRYSDTRSMAQDVRQVADTGRLDSAAGETLIAEKISNPFKGLRAFGEADAEDFFGRDALTQRLLGRLSEGGDLHRFLAVIGPSGSGKSSVVKAGLIPALRRGALPGSEDWFIVDIIPGPHPLAELEQALERVAVNPLDGTLTNSVEDPRGLLRAFELALPDDGSTELVLVIDQFEELFTLVEDEIVRAHLLDGMVNAVLDDRSRVRVVITLRADFIDRPLRYTDFGELLKYRSEIVLPLTPDEMEQAIREPAERVGLRVEGDLVAAVIGDVTDQPGALPLMQYALTETFENRVNGSLSLTEYRALGGVKGALSTRADAIYLDLDSEQRIVAREMFLRLVTLGEGSEDTRRRVLRSELESLFESGSAIEVVIERFGEARLLAFDRDPISRGATVEVGHEALLREWPRLRAWLDDSRADMRLQRSLATAANEWNEAQRESSYLLVGARLEQFDAWERAKRLALTQEEQAYLEASREEHQQQERAEELRKKREGRLERRSRNFLRALVGVLAVAAIGALILSGFAFDQRDQAQDSFLRAERIRLASQAQIALDTGVDATVPALLALRSLELEYSSEADAALIAALERGFPLQQYAGHAGVISSIDISPDQRFVLTASNDETARLWSAESGDELMRFIGHADLVRVARFFPDGRRVLTGSIDGTVRIWDIETGDELRRFPDHGGPVWAVAISPDGKQVLTSDDSGFAYIWDADTLRELFKLSGHGDTVVWGGFSPDGRYVFTGSVDRTARLWDVLAGAEIRRYEGHAGSIIGGAFSPDGKYLVTASNDNTSRIWDVSNGQELQRFVGHTNFIYGAVFSPDSQFVLTTSQDGSARLWSPDNGEQLRQYIGYSGGVGPVAFAPDGQSFLTGSADVGRRWALEFDREPRVFTPPFRSPHAAEVILADFSADGRHIVSGYANGVVRQWDVRTGQVLEEGNFDDAGLVDLVFSPDGKLAITVSNQGITRVWDAATGQPVRELNQGSLIWDLAISPAESWVLTAGDDGTARIWEFRSGEVLREFTGHEASVRAVAFSPDGRKVVTGGEDGSARLWDSGNGEELFVLSGHTGLIRSVAFSPDGRYVLTGSADHSAKLWDAKSGRELRHFTGHSGGVNAVQFSPDGRWVATGSGDLSVRLWDQETGEVVRQFVGAPNTVQLVEFSPDGAHLLTGTFDSLRLWQTELTDVLAFACDQLPRDLTTEERVLYTIADDGPTCKETEQ